MKIAILLTFGFEETEALIPFDVLKRLGCQVDLISCISSLEVESAHQAIIKANQYLSLDLTYDVLILPGGMPGAKNLKENELVIEMVKRYHNANKIIAAICAAPIVLQAAGIIQNKKITSYPTFANQLSCLYSNDSVVIDDNLITSRGVGTAFDFAFAIANKLGYSTEEIKKSMLLDKN